MTIEKKIDEIYEKINGTALSTILPLMLPISLELEDYDGYCIISYWCKPNVKEKGTSITIHNDIKKILIAEGLSLEDATRVSTTAFEAYLQYRSVGKDQVLMDSAKEIENKIQLINEAIEALKLPEGLAPVDVYFLNKTVVGQKAALIKQKQGLEHQYAVLESFITTKLTEMKRMAMAIERKQNLEKKIENSKDIFIIHGHNEAKRRELEKLLKEKFNLNPIVLIEQPIQGLTIIEKFEKYAATCSYVFALFTPDDIVSDGNVQYFQARPNVIFELGWFYARLGRSRVCILDQASEQSKIFSDLQGVLRIQYNENISEKYLEIEQELRTVGII